ncbi:hypothetical protein [Streptomyces sp. bgisy100]|uniref:hypothetical protein n=1 Tax=Streptomyces sp. bgisy100 TaxID=3413783 RepID=UPI003D74C3AD
MPRHEPAADAPSPARRDEQSPPRSPSPAAPPAASPSMSQLLAACAAASAVSTPPEAEGEPDAGIPAPGGAGRRDAA